MIKNSIFLLSILTFLFFSCSKPDLTPTYITFTKENFQDCIDVSNFNSTHETTLNENELEAIKNQKFTDIYLEVNGKNVGYWELPCKIPILPNYSDTNRLLVYPCVRIPNTSLTTTQYRFVNPHYYNLLMTPEQSYEAPKFKFQYVKSAVFPVLETFDQSTSFIPADTIRNPAHIEIYTIENKNVGRVALDDTLNFFNVVTPYFYLTGVGVLQYWEMDYKCDATVFTYLNFQNSTVGLREQEMIILPATGGVWKKIYINLTEVVSLAAGTAIRINTRLGIKGSRDGTKNTYFYFDNVKVVSMSAPY